MSMYIKNYNSSKVGSVNLSSFLKQTYQLLAASVLAASAGTYVGLGMLSILMGPVRWVLFGVELALIFFIIPMVKNIPGINLITLFVFTFITGLTVAPLLGSVLSMANGAMIVGQALLMTGFAFGAISMFAMTTKKDFTSIGRILLISLVVFIVAAISNIFIQSSMLQLAIASVGVILFSVLILYNTQNIIKNAYDTPIEAALSLYLSVLNLFVSILQLLGFAKSED